MSRSAVAPTLAALMRAARSSRLSAAGSKATAAPLTVSVPAPTAAKSASWPMGRLSSPGRTSTARESTWAAPRGIGSSDRRQCSRMVASASLRACRCLPRNSSWARSSAVRSSLAVVASFLDMSVPELVYADAPALAPAETDPMAMADSFRGRVSWPPAPPCGPVRILSADLAAGLSPMAPRPGSLSAGTAARRRRWRPPLPAGCGARTAWSRYTTQDGRITKIGTMPSSTWATPASVCLMATREIQTERNGPQHHGHRQSGQPAPVAQAPPQLVPVLARQHQQPVGHGRPDQAHQGRAPGDRPRRRRAPCPA